jgi:hypothetical protein
LVLYCLGGIYKQVGVYSVRFSSYRSLNPRYSITTVKIQKGIDTTKFLILIVC